MCIDRFRTINNKNESKKIKKVLEKQEKKMDWRYEKSAMFSLKFKIEKWDINTKTLTRTSDWVYGPLDKIPNYN